jgi:hypothetical protein
MSARHYTNAGAQNQPGILTEQATKAFLISVLSIALSVKELEFQRHRFNRSARAPFVRHPIFLPIAVKGLELGDN